MHVFGVVCCAYVQNAKKLEPRSKEGILVGNDKKSPAYLVYCPESRRVERVRFVKFFDSLSPENEVLSTDEEVDTVPSVLPDVKFACDLQGRRYRGGVTPHPTPRNNSKVGQNGLIIAQSWSKWN